MENVKRTSIAMKICKKKMFNQGIGTEGLMTQSQEVVARAIGLT